jgi:hypothetical protein
MSGSLTLHSRVVASSEALSADLGADLAVLDAGTGIYYGLDSVGARIWVLIREPKTLAEVLEVLIEEYEVDRSTLVLDLMEFANKLRDSGLLRAAID